MTDRNAWNREIIAEFRANGGKVGGRFAGRPLLILHTTGAKSGLERLNPLAYQAVGDSFAIFASKGGAPSHPDWFHNLKANPDASIELGAETIPVRARVAEGEERERIWTTQKEQYPNFAEYERLTTRQIPVVILERVG
jgi:deazaflavin-dependent oxidoreductase (nitroreductase family)